MLWLLVGSFLLGGFVSLAIAAYVGVLLFGRAEEAQINARQL
jgi:RsiW-degrading membrane proteinase PrsW (M82 family)